ncbi:MAG: hypothetical protein EHM44_07825 [Ignavibacteriales bacterium]|nr:MAG: hypothetical protein EHM44_07825 [Ignavibacteriales bacterium]
MKSFFWILFLFVFTISSSAQKFGGVAGVEFSKPLFSGKNYSYPGFIFGLTYEDRIDHEIKNVMYQLELSINHVLTIDTREYRYPFYYGDLIGYSKIDHEFSYTSFEFLAHIKIKNIFGNTSPHFYCGSGIGVGSRDVESRQVNEVPTDYMYLLDYKELDVTFPLSFDLGFSYSLNKSMDVDLRYKIIKPILDDEYISQNIYLIFHIH